MAPSRARQSWKVSSCAMALRGQRSVFCVDRWEASSSGRRYCRSMIFWMSTVGVKSVQDTYWSVRGMYGDVEFDGCSVCVAGVK